MRPLAGVLLLVGVGSAAATTAAMRDGLAVRASEESRRPGADSVRIAAVLATLERTDPVVCEMIADQMGNFWWSDGGVGVGQFTDTRRAARAGKDSLSGSVTEVRAIRLLEATLAHEDPCVRLVAAKLLGNSAVDDAMLGATLASPSERVREAGLRAVGERDRPALRPRVERLLADPKSEVAAMAAWALGELEHREAVSVLRRSLLHDAPRVRAAAAWALGQIEDPLAAEDLERLLGRDGDRTVRLAAVRALGEIEATRSAQAIERVLERAMTGGAGGDLSLAIAAAEALQQIEAPGPAPAALVRAAEATDPDLRAAAIDALFEYEDDALIPLFVRLVRDPSAEMRLRAIQALGSLGATAAIPAITRALEDPDAEVRRAAVEALAEIEDR